MPRTGLRDGPPDSPAVLAAEVDGDRVGRIVHVDELPGVAAADRDLLPGDHDDASVAGRRLAYPHQLFGQVTSRTRHKQAQNPAPKAP